MEPLQLAGAEPLQLLKLTRRQLQRLLSIGHKKPSGVNRSGTWRCSDTTRTCLLYTFLGNTSDADMLG
jgi:hypothetical protein